MPFKGKGIPSEGRKDQQHTTKQKNLNEALKNRKTSLINRGTANLNSVRLLIRHVQLKSILGKGFLYLYTNRIPLGNRNV